MDDFDVRNIPPPSESDDEPIPFEDNVDDSEQSAVSHAPLNLGSEQTPTQQSVPSIQPIKPAVQKKDEIPSGSRIIGVKTFFAKLHAGAIEYLDTQVTEWLQKNPEVVIKRISAVTGDVQGKTVEPNIIITIWY